MNTTESKFNAGIEAAAKWVEKRLASYQNEHGSYDPETGGTDYPVDGEEYVGELVEIAEGIRALALPSIETSGGQAPSDARLAAVWRKSFRQARGNEDAAAMLFARAILARWGALATPQLVEREAPSVSDNGAVVGEWPREADILTQAIQRINSSAYNLTKDECIEVLRDLRDAGPVSPAIDQGIQQPIAYALQWPEDRAVGRVCLAVVSVDLEDVEEYAGRYPDSGITILPFYGPASQAHGKSEAVAPEIWDYEVLNDSGTWHAECRSTPPDTDIFEIRNLRKRMTDRAQRPAPSAASSADAAVVAVPPVIHQHGFAKANQTLQTINESLDKQLEEVMAERDDYHDWADKLADAIAEHCGVDIGEHSSDNSPWAEALDALAAAPALDPTSKPAQSTSKGVQSTGHDAPKRDAALINEGTISTGDSVRVEGGQARVEPMVRIDFKQSAALLDLFGGMPCEFTLQQSRAGHSGPGLYAWATEYPEEGAYHLGPTEGDAAPVSQQPAPTQPEAALPPHEVLCEHSGCGHGPQSNQISFALHPGDRVVKVLGRYSAALAQQAAPAAEGGQ